MIVCSCHAVSDHALREATARGLDAEQIAELTGAGTGCGHCSGQVAAIVAKDRGPCRCQNACPGCTRRVSA